MGNSYLSKLALPGVHNYTCPVNDAHIRTTCGENVNVLAWLHPSNGTVVDYSRNAIPIVCTRADRDVPSNTVIVYSHGNAEDVSMTSPWAEHLSHQFDVDVMCYDYTGYGTNYNAASNESIYHNCTSVLAYIHKHHPHYTKIILYGRSIGTAPAVFGAVHDDKVHAVILQSAFCSVVTTQLPMYMKKAVPRCLDMMFNDEMLKKCTAPTLLIHGTKDRVVPFSHGLRLAKHPCVWGHCWVEGAKHNDMETFYADKMCLSIEHFLQAIDHTSPPLVMPHGRPRLSH